MRRDVSDRGRLHGGSASCNALVMMLSLRSLCNYGVNKETPGMRRLFEIRRRFDKKSATFNLDDTHNKRMCGMREKKSATCICVGTHKQRKCDM
mmetsp:Transcript_25269/g.81721  ORF Transcript_25269/g.81721 Transcript_25269/m.81721 type:complete len:94 (-) Transcript_25269:294-575(-)